MRQNSHAAKLTPVNKAYNSVISPQPQGCASGTTAPVLVSPEGHAAVWAAPLHAPPTPRPWQPPRPLAFSLCGYAAVSRKRNQTAGGLGAWPLQLGIMPLRCIHTAAESSTPSLFMTE